MYMTPVMMENTLPGSPSPNLRPSVVSGRQNNLSRASEKRKENETAVAEAAGT